MKMCEHLDYDNRNDCEEEAVMICQCCGAGACEEHGIGRCPYGGKSFIEI